MTMTLEGALSILAILTTPDEVAMFLHEHGIKGVRGAPISCPLARWLTKVTDVDMRIYTMEDPFGDKVARIYPMTVILLADNSHPHALASLPTPCLHFIEAFDIDGAYEFLREDEE